MFKFDLDTKPQTPSIQEIRERDVLSADVLARIADLLRNAIKHEIKKEQARQRGLKRAKGAPVGLPQDPKFAESFRVVVSGQTLEILSTWPTAEALVEGKRPYRMKWLVRSKVPVVPMKGLRGSVEFRATPIASADAWVHPGFRKHDFLDKAFERAFDQAADLVVKQLLTKMASKRYL